MLKVDLHTHSIASGHALNTVYELAEEARNKGIKILGITDHGPSMLGTTHESYFNVSEKLYELYGVKIFMGVEANIINVDGEIDLPPELLKKQKIVAACVHYSTPYKGISKKDHTTAIINAMQNPLVKIITHPYREDYPVDIEKIFEAAYKTKTLLELNDAVFSREYTNKSFLKNYRALVELSKEYGYPLLIGSDAHVASEIGGDIAVMAVSELIGLSDNIVINNYIDAIFNWSKDNIT